MAKSRPEPDPSSEPLERGAVPWLLAVALATAAPHADHLPLWLTALAAGALIWRGVLWQQNGRLPARRLLALLVVAGVAGIGWQYRTLFGRDAGVALLVFFMAFKPMEMHTRRDSMVVVMLGFFLLLTHYFYSQSIPTGIWLLTATALLTATLIRIHGGTQPVLSIARHAALLLAQAVPFMLLAFLLFPRVSGPLWGLPRDAHSGMTGLSDQMSPGSLNNLIQSGEIAFRVQFAGDMPEKSHLYWRGPVLDTYDGLTWRSRSRTSLRTDIEPRIETEAGAKTYRYVSTLEAHNQRWLLALDMPVSLPDGSALSVTLEARLGRPLHSRARFALVSATDFIVNRRESATVLQQGLQLPANLNPRSRELASGWRRQFGSSEEIVNAALQRFQQEAFFYTLQPPLLGENSVDDFLFTTRRGFCEHYASAFVFLMRAAGVPARVVTGYQGGEINPVDDYLIVRQSDAHAWAEVWMNGKGWVRVDPTAAVSPARIERGIGAALPAGDRLPVLVRIDTDWLRDLRNRWEAANNAWNQWVLGYNPQRQRDVLSRLGLADPDWRRMTAVLATLCGLMLIVVTAWTLRQRTPEPPELKAWKGFCRRLGRLGIARRAWEGPLDFAQRVTLERPEFGQLARDAARHFADLRYGTGDPRQLRQLKECTRSLPRYRSRIRRNTT